jgi:hypothetical protein
MNHAARLDAFRRMADVKSVLARQELLRSDYQAQGLPSEQIDYCLGVLRGCLAVIEASLIDDQEKLVPPATHVFEAA